MGKGHELVYFNPVAERQKVLFENLPEHFKLEVTLMAGFYERKCRNIFSLIENHTNAQWDWQARNLDYNNYRKFLSRARCSIRTDCCSALFAGANRIVGRVTASQIASASAASFLFVLTKGRTY